MKPIIIIGTGLAGYAVAREFRKIDRQKPLILISRDDAAFYSKPMLSSAIGKGKNAAGLVTSSAAEKAKSLNAEILTNTEITHVDPQAHTVQVDGKRLEYESLVMAVGATPIRIPIAGDAGDDILSVNNLTDYALFRKQLPGKQKVAIIGPGLIGCEFANDLLSAKIQVSVIGPDPWPISGLIPEAAGRALEQALAAEGVDWHLGTTTRSIEKTADGYRVSLENDATLDVDLVLSAVGLRPDIALAKAIGLETNRGIVTNRQLLTSDPDIYAIGDCAEVDGKNLPYVMPLMVGSKVLAKQLAGETAEIDYPIMPVIIKTTRHPVVAVPPSGEGKWQLEIANDGVCGRFVDSQGKLTGFVLTGTRTEEKSALLREMM